MKSYLLLLLLAAPLFSQSPEATKYAPRPLMLVSTEGEEGVMPMSITENGATRLEFVPVSKVKEMADKGGQLIRLGDVLSALNEASQTIEKLKAENEKLWKVAMKDQPPPAPQTVVVQQPVAQQPAPSQPSALDRYLLLRSLLPGASQNVNMNVRVSDCTRLPALCVGR